VVPVDTAGPTFDGGTNDMGGTTRVRGEAGRVGGRVPAGALVVVAALAVLASACATTGAWNDVSPPTTGFASRNESVNGLACATPSRCVLTNGSTLTVWNGSTWRISPAPGDGYTAAACAAPDFCLAYATEKRGETGGRPLHWTGTAWEPTADPAGVFTPESVVVQKLACFRPTACVAVNRTAFGLAAATWNGTAWAAATPPEPLGTSGGAAVDCGTDSCTLLLWVSPLDSTADQAYRWDGTSWSTLATAPRLTAVTCAGRDFCLGSEGDLAGTLAAGDGTAWTPVPSPLAGRDGYVLQAVDCGAPRDCTAIAVNGGATGSAPQLALRWTGGSTWSPTGPGSGTAESEDLLACATATWCMTATTEASPRGFVDVAARWDGTSWMRTPVPSDLVAHQALGAVSCPSETSCLAVGFTANEAGQSLDAQTWNGTAWTAVPPPVGATASVSDVSCPTADMCAVGGLSTAQGPILAVRQAGAWRTTPAPDGFRDTEVRLDCARATWCVAAVGRGDIQRWDGTGWAPLAGPDGYVYDIACPAPDRCIAVGQTLYATVPVPAFFHWDGRTWTTRYVPRVNDVDAWLNRISCGAVDRCAAVGSAYPYPAVAQWDGTEWTDQRAPSTDAGGELREVSCAATVCMATGVANDNPAPVVAITTDVASRVWEHAQPPTDAAAFGLAPSCTATGCLVVGGRYDSDDESSRPWAARYQFAPSPT
jgi:hypothetical protein